MKKILIFSLFLLMAAQPALATKKTGKVNLNNPNCGIPDDAFISPLDTKDKSIKVIQKPTISAEDRKLSYIVEFKDGARVKYVSGGCVDWLTTYTFSNIKDFPQKLDQKTIELIKSYFAQIPMKTKPHITPEELMNAAFSEKTLQNLNPNGNMPENTPENFIMPYEYGEISFSINKDGFEITYMIYT